VPPEPYPENLFLLKMISTLSPPEIPQRVLEEFANQTYGLAGDWSKLEGERDQNFRVTENGGSAWVFKVCHPDEGDAVLTCQAEALEHIAIADEELPVPRLRRSLNREALPRLQHEGRDYPVMLLSWLGGGVIGETELPRETMRAMGSLLARLGLAMRGFVHGAPAGAIWCGIRAMC
jgi:hydroxylysine kinase